MYKFHIRVLDEQNEGLA